MACACRLSWRMKCNVSLKLTASVLQLNFSMNIVQLASITCTSTSICPRRTSNFSMSSFTSASSNGNGKAHWRSSSVVGAAPTKSSSASKNSSSPTSPLTCVSSSSTGVTPSTGLWGIEPENPGLNPNNRLKVQLDWGWEISFFWPDTGLPKKVRAKPFVPALSAAELHAVGLQGSTCGCSFDATVVNGTIFCCSSFRAARRKEIESLMSCSWPEMTDARLSFLSTDSKKEFQMFSQPFLKADCSL
mmetsp:Transcript_79610/g.129010  ORF Transcript_79610/g.129010 Transcript_79610/m.129010 type:complete len:246 (+) Transcript_79610:3493-4230(+)